jgi:GNAT superfamily N-acetyltransferase
MSDVPQQDILERLEIRTYRPQDLPDVRRLYEVGRLAGHVPPQDTTTDLENLEQTYLSDERVHFWVAELEGGIVGMVGVKAADRDKALVRRLRLDPAVRGQGIGFKLMETALAFCRRHGYLKVIFDTHMEGDRETRDVFDRFAFQHARNRIVDGKEVQEFYLDLYREPKEEKPK